MKHLRWIGGLGVFCVAAVLPALAQHEAGTWRAESKTAKGVTGDIAFGGQKLVINFAQFTVAQLHELSADEVLALFNPDNGATGRGSLFRLDIPATQRFLHKNTLCGSEPTEFMATYIDGKQMQVAFFSGNKMPTLSIDALSNNSNLCGTYTYSR